MGVCLSTIEKADPLHQNSPINEPEIGTFKVHLLES